MDAVGVNELSDYTVRPAVADDLEAILNLVQPVVLDRKVLRRTRAEMLALLSTGFVALLGDEVVGFCAIEVYSKKLAEIQNLVVSAKHRRHGIGAKLVDSCVDLAKERGVMEVMAISSSESFLQDLGFDYSLPDQKRALFRQLRSRDEVYRELEGENDS